MFWFKKKKIIVDCFVSENNAQLLNTAPVQKSIHFYPDWAKKIQTAKFDFSNMKNNTNIKSCYGFYNFFSHGFMVPMWSDLALKVNDDLSWQYKFADGRSSMTYHENNQAPGFLDDHIFFKIHNPWFFDTKEDIDFLTTGCSWNNSKIPPYFTPTGVIKFNDNFLQTQNIFALVKKQKQEIFINFGQPMLHVIPLSDKPVELNLQVLTNSQLYKRQQRHNSFVNNYKNMKRVEEGKCPFRTRTK